MCQIFCILNNNSKCILSIVISIIRTNLKTVKKTSRLAHKFQGNHIQSNASIILIKHKIQINILNIYQQLIHFTSLSLPFIIITFRDTISFPNSFLLLIESTKPFQFIHFLFRSISMIFSIISFTIHLIIIHDILHLICYLLHIKMINLHIYTTISLSQLYILSISNQASKSIKYSFTKVFLQ